MLVLVDVLVDSAADRVQYAGSVRKLVLFSLSAKIGVGLFEALAGEINRRPGQRFNPYLSDNGLNHFGSDRGITGHPCHRLTAPASN